MKIMCVGDNDMCTMFQLLGIEGKNIDSNNSDTFKTEFNELLKDINLGLIIISEKYLIRYPDYFKVVKLRKTPIIVDIPDLKNPLETSYFEAFMKKHLNLPI
jgi:vacuolar-type H+-ATPase subunit F/Vma7